MNILEKIKKKLEKWGLEERKMREYEHLKEEEKS